MATIAEQTFYQQVHDPLYSVTTKPISVDADTIRKSTRTIPASANGSGTMLDPLNGKQSTFDFSNGGTNRMRWDTSVLEIDLKFSATSKTDDAITTYTAPSWNMLGRLIDQISLKINGTQIYFQNGTNYYLADFTSRMLRNYTYEQLQKRDDCLFTPIGDEEYAFAHADAAIYVNGGSVLVNNAGAYAKLTDDSVAAVSAAGTTKACYLEGYHSASKKRYERYIKAGLDYAAGDLSNKRYCTLRVPFADLFPKWVGIPLNLRSVQIEIFWNSSTALLGKIGDGAAGNVQVIGTRIFTDDYVMAPLQKTEIATDKVAGESDNIAFLMPVVREINWTSDDIIITGQRNLDSVMLFQLGHTCSVNTTTHALGQDSGQFYLFNSEAKTGFIRRKSIGIPYTGETGGHLPVPTDVQLLYGDVVYPQEPIKMIKDSTNCNFISSGIYYEYCKALGKICDRLNGHPIPREIFESTMPFIFLKPFANDGAKISEAKDVIIRLTGAPSSITETVNKKGWVVLFELVSYRILTDGTVISQSIK